MDIRKLVENINLTSSGFPDRTLSEKGKVYTCLNPYSYHIFKKHSKEYERLDGIFVDGMLMCRLIYRLWGYRIPRLSMDMSGMAPVLFSRLNDPASTETLYLIGARQQEVENTARQIREAYPNIHIAGVRNGYFKTPEERRKAIEEIVSKQPDFTLIGMGSPLQETFAADLRDAGYKGIGFTCGGFLHQTSSNINYYPEWVNKYELRAFYRLYKEKGLFGRLYNVLLQFPALFTADTMKYKCGKKKCD